MGELLQIDFRAKLSPLLKNYSPQAAEDYQRAVFKELCANFPQFKASVASYIERHYCFAVNDEDHGDTGALLSFLKPEEVKQLNRWLVGRQGKPRGQTAPPSRKTQD